MNLSKYISLGLLLLFLGMQLHSQNCDPDVQVATPITTGMVRTVQASNSILGTSTVQTGATATFDAGFEITLAPNFDAAAGANFDAVIGGCTNTVSLPNDPYFPWQWGHYNTGNVPIYQFGVPVPQRPTGGVHDADADILEAWETTKGSPNITVAILDYGIDMNHPDIAASRVINGFNFVNNTSNFQDGHGHGTLTAGILGATPNNGIGIAGVDWNCKIMPLKIFSGTSVIDPNRNRSAIEHAIQHDADIISMSFGRPNPEEKILEVAYREAIDAGILLFAATGNDNSSNLDYPARYPSIVGVGAMSPCGQRKSSVLSAATGSCDRDDREDAGISHWGSNYGDGLDFVAPGTLLPTTDVTGLPNGYSALSGYQSDANGDYLFDSYGTSVSSPFAAGVAALVWATNPSLKHYQVRYILQQSAAPLNGTDTGHGSLNAKAAVNMAQTFVNSDHLLPNLTLELTSAPTSVSINSTLYISYRIKNTGDALAGASILSYRAHPQAPVNTLAIPPLGVDQVHTGTLLIPATSSCNSGSFDAESYTMDFTVDYLNQVEEFNEFNTFSHTYEVLGYPDLTINNVNLGTNVLTFEIGNAGFSRVNYGCAPACAFYRYYWSSDAMISNDDPFELGYLTVMDLCPGQTSSVVKTLNPQGNPNYLILAVDYLNAIAESSESNNILAIPLNSRGQSSKMAFSHSSTSSIQVIPNPLAQNGVVRYTLELKSEVSIVMYDVMGAKVQTILPRKQQARGSHEIPFQKGGLPSGMYLVEIQINGGRYIEKLLVE